jgi:hypothetical protein
MMLDDIHLLLKGLKGSFVPPLVLEICLKDGNSYYVQTVFEWEDDNPTVAIRIWDFRMLTKDDLKTLRETMNHIRDRTAYGDPAGVHPKLDVANLLVPKDRISHCVDWHDRSWPLGLDFKPKGPYGYVP